MVKGWSLLASGAGKEAEGGGIDELWDRDSRDDERGGVRNAGIHSACVVTMQPRDALLPRTCCVGDALRHTLPVSL